jgi:uncharacterized BrkB/YihY/UPF0761 family membrane protein|nr:MAG: hypothetical protein KatS3mg041_0049 [Bacteroidota bacterium]
MREVGKKARSAQAGRSCWKAFWYTWWRVVQREPIFYMASALAFALGLAILPLLLFVLSGLGFVLSSSEVAYARVRDWLEAYLPVLERFTPERGLSREHLEALLFSLIEGRRVTGLVALGSLFLTGSSLIATLRTTLHAVFGFSESRHLLVSKLYDVLWFGILGSIVVILGVSGTLIGILWEPLRHLGGQGFEVAFSVWMRLIGLLGPLLALGVNVGLFALLFRFVPEVRLPWSTAWVGSGGFSLLLELARYGVGFYLAHAFPRLNALYGSYSLLLLLVLWCYYVALTFVLSVTIAAAYEQTCRTPGRTASAPEPG